MKVLLVDDRAENIYLARQLLEKRNCEVEEAANGIEALQKLRHQNFDLVISDIMMPDMDGFQLCHRVKTDEALKSIPFVFYTATYTDPKDEALALSLGASTFIVKPIEPGEFLRRIEDILRKTAQHKVLPHQTPPEESIFLKQYNVRLVHKLENKVSELEKANQQLKELSATLEQRVESAHAELLQKNRELESFTYSVSHDLRAPVRSIAGMASVLESDLAGKLTEEQKHYFGRIQKGAARMQKLIDDLIQYSHVTNGAVLVELVSLATVMEQALENLSVRITETRATITIPQPLPTVLGYEPVLVQVFMNLLDNALKYVAKGIQPVIEVTTETIGNHVVITFQDNGIGIEPVALNKIFKAFERGTADANYSGSGIGLAIVQKGLERMGGAISVASEPGQGSRFRVELPRGS